MSTDVHDLELRLSECMIADRHRLARRLRDGHGERVVQEIERSASRRAQRQRDLPKPRYPGDLPVVQKRDDIAKAIAENQVVVICGETGSGKTTQIPKICLELGRGVAGMIGHTQPRRIAARSVAARIAEELDTPLGHAVGYKVRFSDKLSDQTYLKLMTDGILLAETQGDRFLNRYDTIIIDEAHERSLNIDFLLGYLKQLLPRRADLKLIITSATINPAQFSRHFNDAPVVEVSGRTYPVEVRYRPPVAEDPDEDDPEPIEAIEAIVAAVDELWRDGPGDVLIFLAGERDIRETAEALRKHHPPGVEVLPLYARLGASDQLKIFQAHNRPRIVLATNVAETSLTVPGIKYVIDPGVARISRYTPRTKVQRLPIEHISRASADQRKGRCGRTSEGICIRLYDEQDFETRAAFTEPEILRTNLASVILQMKALRLGDIQDFPFLEPPDYRQIKDGFQTLHELGAIDEKNELTPLGRDLSKLPIDPRVGRMILAAYDEQCVEQVLILAAALSTQDPRERPLDKQQQADAAHLRFADERSDFLGLLKLWTFYKAQEQHLSSNKLRRLCKESFLSFVRMREWDDIHQQLKALAGEVLHLRHPRHRFSHSSTRELSPKHIDAIHRALLAGLLGNVGVRSEAHEYLGGGGKKFSIFPGSGLFKRKPAWIMAAEIVETTKLYARTVAAIQPQWIERLAQHLVKRTYTEPHWQPQSAHVAAFEKVTLYGLPIVARRTVHFGPIDPPAARQLFIHHALVLGEWRSSAEFFQNNRQLVAEIRSLEAKRRQRDLLVDDQVIYDFYDKRIPHDIYNGPLFEKWRLYGERGRPTLLFMQRRDLMQREVEDNKHDYPDALHLNGIKLPLTYAFDPSDPDDGVTVTVPLAALNQLPSEPFEWLVPGLLREKVISLMKTMPKSLRVKFVPIPESANAALNALDPAEGSLLDALATRLGKISGEPIDRTAFAPEDLPPYLLMNFRIIDDAADLVMAGRDLEKIRRELGLQARKTFQQQPPSEFHRDGITSWDFGDLPDRVEVRRNGMTLQGYPTLVDAGQTVALRLFDSEPAARASTRAGVRRLLMLQLREEVKWLSRKLPGFERMCLHYKTVGDCDQLKADLIDAITDRALFGEEAEVRTRQQFVDRAQIGWRRLSVAANEIGELVVQILEKHHALDLELSQVAPPALIPSYQDMRRHLARLVYDGFVVRTPPDWLKHYPRYLAGLESRLRKLLNAGLSRDMSAMHEIIALQKEYDDRLTKHAHEGVTDPELETFRWMLEELRISLFAQELKTAVPVSLKRLEAQWMKVKR